MMRMKHRLKKRTVIIGSIAVALIIIGIVVSIIIHEVSYQNDHAIIKDTGYATLLPEGKTIADLGGWVRVSPTNSDPVYAYNDILTDVPISVSEQPLPESFKDNSDAKVAKLAKEYNATATLGIGDTTIYIGTSAKGPQSVIFTKSHTLILIKSEKEIKNEAWSSYASSLQ